METVWTFLVCFWLWGGLRTPQPPTCVRAWVCSWLSWLSGPIPVHPRTVVTFSSVRDYASFSVWRFRALVGASCFPNHCLVSSPSVLLFIFENAVTILREPYSLKWYTFLITLLLNGMLHYQYFVTALKLLFTQYRLLLFTNPGNISKTTHYLI